MNLVEATADDGMLRIAGCDLPVPAGYELEPGRRVIIGAPPVAAHAVAAARDADEDDDARIIMDDQRAHWIVRVAGRARPRTGEPIEVVVDAEHMHLFDPATGAAIAAA